jgi:nucleoid-associated protein YgaU
MTFDDLKLKYQSALNLAPMRGISLKHVHLEGGKLYVEGVAPSEDVKNEFWNQVKLVDASFGDAVFNISVDTSIAPAKAPKTYTVVKGDSLWAIAEKHLGGGQHYPKIIAANPGQLKDDKSVIHPGDVLVIPD